MADVIPLHQMHEKAFSPSVFVRKEKVQPGVYVKQLPLTALDLSDLERSYVNASISAGEIQGDKTFSKACEALIKARVGCARAYLTPSCTAALEATSVLLDLRPGDEVIMPSFTFTSTANAYALRWGVPVFVDIDPVTLNIDVHHIAKAITAKTRAIVVVHYAGYPCDMDPIMKLAEEHGIYVIEDAAQAYGSEYKGRPLGSIGHAAAFSFHQTKNIGCGEGGALLINDVTLVDRAEVIREKGTNRRLFIEGKVDKYSWVDIGSSYLLSDLSAALLRGQLERADEINRKRGIIYRLYQEQLHDLALRYELQLPAPSEEHLHNAHIFFMVLPTVEQRSRLEAYLNDRGMGAYRHYVALHSAQAGKVYGKTYGRLPVTEFVAERLIRLPLSSLMSEADANLVVSFVKDFFLNDH